MFSLKKSFIEFLLSLFNTAICILNRHIFLFMYYLCFLWQQSTIVYYLLFLGLNFFFVVFLEPFLLAAVFPVPFFFAILPRPSDFLDLVKCKVYASMNWIQKPDTAYFSYIIWPPNLQFLEKIYILKCLVILLSCMFICKSCNVYIGNSYFMFCLHTVNITADNTAAMKSTLCLRLTFLLHVCVDLQPRNKKIWLDFLAFTKHRTYHKVNSSYNSSLIQNSF